jgi:hypothetical protein
VEGHQIPCADSPCRAARADGIVEDPKIRRSEEESETQPTRHASRSGAGRRPATEVMREPHKQAPNGSSVACLYGLFVWLVHYFGRATRGPTGVTRCNPSLSSTALKFISNPIGTFVVRRYDWT